MDGVSVRRRNKANRTEQSCMSHNKQSSTENFTKRDSETQYLRWAAKMSVFELRWQYFTSITVQFILLKLFFRKKQKKKERIYWSSRDTAEIVCNIGLDFPSAVMHGQSCSVGRIDPCRCSISCMTAQQQNWPRIIQNLLLTAEPHLISIYSSTFLSTAPRYFPFFLLCVIIFTFHLHVIPSKGLQASKTQTSNTISVPATSNEPGKIFPIKGPRGNIAKLDGRKKKAGSIFYSVMLWRRCCKGRRVSLVSLQTQGT